MRRCIARWIIAGSLAGLAPLCHAANATDYLENLQVDFIFRAQTWTAPAGIYIKLCTTTPTDSTPCTEASYTGYARGSLARSVSNWKSTNGTTSGASSGTSGTTSNAAIITIGTDATSGPQTITAFEIYDASTGGNRLYYANLTASKTINSGDPAPTFAVDALTVQVDN